MVEKEEFLSIKKKEIKKNRKKFKKLLKIGNQIANQIMNESITYNRELEKLIDSNIVLESSLQFIQKEDICKEKRALKLIKIYLEGANGN